jgi:magnesium transporter
MIRTLLHNINTGETQWGDEGLFAEWKDNPELWIWADFDSVDTEHEQALFIDTFELHPLAISDAQQERHPPKLEVFDNCFFLLMRGLDATTKDIDFTAVQIAFFVGERFLVTRRNHESVSVDTTWADTDNGNLYLSLGPAHAAYRILRRMTDRYTGLIEDLEQKLEDIEGEMFENPRDALLERLINYGQNLKRLQRIFNYHQNMFVRLNRKDHPFVDKKRRHEYTDIFEHTERLASLTSLYKELTDDLMNGYISVTSHRLNQIMKVLTIVTVTFLPLALLVGIYGMNFENMPELKFKNAYYVLLSVMAGIVIALLLLFRKMRWL